MLLCLMARCDELCRSLAWHKRMLHGPRGVTAWGHGARGPAAAAGRCPRSPGLSPLWHWDGSSLPGSLQHLLRHAPKLVVPNSPSVVECCICSPCPASPAREPQNPSLQAPSAALPAGASICSFLGAREKVPSPGVVAKREVCFWLLQCGERLLAVSWRIKIRIEFLLFFKISLLWSHSLLFCGSSTLLRCLGCWSGCFAQGLCSSQPRAASRCVPTELSPCPMALRGTQRPDPTLRLGRKRENPVCSWRVKMTCHSLLLRNLITAPSACLQPLFCLGLGLLLPSANPLFIYLLLFPTPF